MVNSSILIPGFEVIDFQPQSSFAKALTAVFQEVIDFRDALDYSSLPSQQETYKREYREIQVYKFCVDVMQNKMRKVIEKEIGLNIRSVLLTGGPTVEADGMFAIDLSFDDVCSANDIQASQSGMDFVKLNADESTKELAEMMKNLDTKTGRLKSSTFGKHNRQISAKLFFDVNTAFCMQDFTLGDIEPLTAEEIAAIMMHECGHAITFIEHAADLYFMKNRVNAYLVEAKHWEPKEFLTAIETHFSQFFTKPSTTSGFYIGMPLTSDGNKALQTVVLKMWKALKEVLMKMDTWNPQESFFLGFTYQLWYWLNLFGQATVVMVLSAYIQFYWAGMVWHELYRYLTADTQPGDEKKSDIYASRNRTFEIERRADEYAARHGMGQYLASALNKLQDFFNISKYGGHIYSDSGRNLLMYIWMVRAFNWVTHQIDLFDYLKSAKYENQYERNQRILENSLAIFKNKKLSGPVKDMWIRNIEALKKSIEESKTWRNTKVADMLGNIFMNMASPIRWVAMVKNAHLDKDFARFENHVDAMKNNEFWYQSAKLQS